MERRQEGTGSLPHHDAGGDADVERVFRAVLRNFQGAVAGIDDTLLHALDLVAEDESERPSPHPPCREGVVTLFISSLIGRDTTPSL